jgi:hypothetical protein
VATGLAILACAGVAGHRSAGPEPAVAD